MVQESVTHEATPYNYGDNYNFTPSLLGPMLCWAIVFANIGSSVYYVPGILYGNVGQFAGLFVLSVMPVFVLLALKYAEITHRFPQGGGVVTVAAQAINHWIGALGGMFILIDYFITVAISCLSATHYLVLVFPVINPFILEITISIIVLMALFNLVASMSTIAKVALIAAIIAFLSDIAILITIFTHISFSDFIALIPQMFANHSLGTTSILIGFSASFLAFSGLESISQISPVMKTPRKKVAGLALLLVVLTICITSPLLTLLTTMLLPTRTLENPTLSNQIVSLLAGHWGLTILQTEVAISAGVLLLCASNTAIVCVYRVLIVLSRMDFFPAFLIRRNKLRGTPHYSIIFATFLPIIILIIVKVNINVLGDLYTFSLLGAFTLTCLGLDLVRYRERKTKRTLATHLSDSISSTSVNSDEVLRNEAERTQEHALMQDPASLSGLDPETITILTSLEHKNWRTRLHYIWYNLDFWLGILTTFVVLLAWSTILIAKPLATLFGITATFFGMGLASINYRLQKVKGYLPVVTIGLEGRLPGSVLAVLTEKKWNNDMIIHSAINSAGGRPVIFLYLSELKIERIPQLFGVYDPYLYDHQAKEFFGKAENLARKSKVACRFVYGQLEPNAIEHFWQEIQPHDTLISHEDNWQFDDEDDESLEPDRIRYEQTPNGVVVHLLKRW